MWPGFRWPRPPSRPVPGAHLVHAGVAARADERKKLERLCRYINRPAVAEKRLSLTPNGNVRYQLKTPYRDGTTHVIFVPVDFIAKLAALVPKPGVNLTRFHGVFAPNSKHRALVTPAKRGKGNKPKAADGQEEQMPVQRHAAMTGFCSCRTGIHAIHGNNLGAPKVGPWRGRLKRVFTNSRRFRRD
jgi:Putative transposase